MTSLPPELGQLINLRELYLGSGAFRSVPRELLDLEHLEVVQLRGGEINIPFWLDTTDALKYATNPFAYYARIASIALVILAIVIFFMVKIPIIRHAISGGLTGGIVSALVAFGLLLLVTPLFPGPSALLPGVICITMTPILVIVSVIVGAGYWVRRKGASQDGEVIEKAKHG